MAGIGLVQSPPGPPGRPAIALPAFPAGSQRCRVSQVPPASCGRPANGGKYWRGTVRPALSAFAIGRHLRPPWNTRCHDGL